MGSRQQGKRGTIAAAVAIIFTVGALGGCATAPGTASDPGQHWVASWGAAQMLPETANELPAADWRDASIRQVVHLSLGGSQVRVRLSNAYGTAPLLVDAASVARAVAPGRAAIDAATLQALTFDGRSAVTIPAGAEYYSDPVSIEVPAGADLAISLHFTGEPARQTSHSGARASSFLAAGNRTADADWPGAATVTRWFAIADVDVLAPRAAGALVAIGDSITDGYGVTTDGNDRWTDVLAARLRRDNVPIGTVNAGIGGGRMLKDGLGPNLVSRFERDVLGRAGVTHALVLIGVNDLGNLHRNTPDLPADRRQLLADLRLAHRQLASRARARGVCLIGATVTPYVGSDYYHPEPANEADRQELNAWIREAGVFDAVVDFDAALRDPAQPQRLAPQYDSGDHLHPSLAGYRAMADAVPLEMLRRRCRSRP
ncbi:UNVERIFIED_ORG: lysophospholipase L1-like esterase [Zoogloea ramigera]|uniref:SGNH/GDSL hydrolase family protein n=1 Tax=Duganella zoogloeoides TaxID=75659 RepID=A0ABZ0Y601_9BURK|nr:SGNH/GDSL hydrolase family protein [Duganella zoogloeoides]WQH07269.1 SGNH/GDSL hydrolase family protein [Duganella zoogloeoides]